MTKIKAQEGKKCIFCRFLKIWLPGTQPGENLRLEKFSFVIVDLPGVGSHKEFTIWDDKIFWNVKKFRVKNRFLRIRPWINNHQLWWKFFQMVDNLVFFENFRLKKRLFWKTVLTHLGTKFFRPFSDHFGHEKLWEKLVFEKLFWPA